MTKIKLLLTALLLTLAGCASTSQPALQPQKIQTEKPGYFSENWMTLLQTFKTELARLSSDATGSTSTPSAPTTK